MLTVFGAVAQLERDYLKDRQMEGIPMRNKGRYAEIISTYYKL
jgi:DNA invertase Pin-like site-specific DNA recombinase